MKYSPLIYTVLLICFASMSAACGSANPNHFLPDERMHMSEFDDVQIEYLTRVLRVNRDNLVLLPGAAFVRHVDLNGDGTDEICISFQTPATCSNGVSVCTVLVLEDWSKEPLLRSYGHLLVAEQVAAETWPRLVGVWAAADGIIRKRYYDHEDGKYLVGRTTEIGSWAEQECATGEYEPLMLCSPDLVAAMQARQ